MPNIHGESVLTLKSKNSNMIHKAIIVKNTIAKEFINIKLKSIIK